MIIIPEKELVLITPPRTGSTTLSVQIAEKYPRSFRPYRHMEADGVPFGYDRWRRIGVFREPVARLWSVYHYCQTVEGRGTPGWRERMFKSVGVPFEEWLVENSMVFTDSFDWGGRRYLPHYAVRHRLPENRKSLFQYLRPDLGTEVLTLRRAMSLLGFNPALRVNASDCPQAPGYEDLSGPAQSHLATFFSWDLGMVEPVIK